MKARKPQPVGPAHRVRGWKNDRRNGTRVHRGGNADDTWPKEKAPKGESQERRRCEIKPARNPRAKAVERVIKPWGRTLAGR